MTAPRRRAEAAASADAGGESGGSVSAQDHSDLGVTRADRERMQRALEADCIAASLRNQAQSANNLIKADSPYKDPGSWVAGETCRDWRREIATTNANPPALAERDGRSPSTIQSHIRGECRHSHTSRNPPLEWDADAGGWHRVHPPGQPAAPAQHTEAPADD